MIRREKRVLLRHYLEQGMTKAAIARHVGRAATRYIGRLRRGSWTGIWTRKR
ncbi:MAG: hypothetical protein OXH51_00775 [Gemmatimonadetes bacterium]|nr:hypothetical protein [Gemmatimonadota bacterium]MCY3677770.1 hypothetical protein [Gemmatimonadota bacterium]